VSRPPYRVAQWATGNIGTRALREVIRHPDLELVGVLVYDPAKSGIDAGTLCGEEPVGIAATTDPAVIRAAGADCVLHMARTFEIDDVVSLLEAGINVITTRGELFDGGSKLSSPDRERIKDACKRGGSSIFATGSSPGFITDALPLALLSMSRRVESIEIEEFADLSQRDSPHLLFQQMGFGQPVASFEGAQRATYLQGEFGPSLRALAEAAGLAIEKWDSRGDAAAARETMSIAAGELPAGSVAAQRTTITGSTGQTERMRFSVNWYCSRETDPEWDLRPTGWRVRVRGDVPMDLELAFAVPLEEMGAASPSFTANRPVNAVSYVCQAPPGILSTTDLVPITPAGLSPAAHAG
jgi:hypothetical protein